MESKYKADERKMHAIVCKLPFHFQPDSAKSTQHGKDDVVPGHQMKGDPVNVEVDQKEAAL